MGTLFSAGTSWVVALQGLGDWLSLPMKFFTFHRPLSGRPDRDHAFVVWAG